jgi:hypothetical protein
MKKISVLVLIALSIVLPFACKKDKDKINISGFLLTDAFGVTITAVGDADDDWKLNDWSSFSAFEKSLFDFPDTVSLSGTAVSNLQVTPAYPNPANSASAIAFSSSDTVKLKIVLVDSRGQRLRYTTLKFKGSKALMFDISERNVFPLGGGFRYYYSFSAATQQNFKVGHGDIKVCNSTDFTQCF